MIAAPRLLTAVYHSGTGNMELDWDQPVYNSDIGGSANGMLTATDRINFDTLLTGEPAATEEWTTYLDVSVGTPRTLYVGMGCVFGAVGLLYNDEIIDFPITVVA